MLFLQPPVPRQPTPAERDLLAGFARLDMSLSQLRRRLREMLKIDFGPKERRLASHFQAAEPGIRIEKWHVQNALTKRSEERITDRELSEWATMLLMNDAYDWEGPDEEEIAESLNELSAPWFFGKTAS